MQVLLLFNLYFNHKTEGFFSITRSLNVNDSSFKQAAVWSTWRDVTILKTLRHDMITTWAKRQLPRASSRLWKKTATNEPLHKISNNVICATSKDSDQPTHTRSLIRAFASRWNFLCVLCYKLNIIWSLYSVTKPRGVWRNFLVPPAAKSSTRSIASELQSIVSILFSSRFQRHIAYSKGKSEFFTTVLMDLSPD